MVISWASFKGDDDDRLASFRCMRTVFWHANWRVNLITIENAQDDFSHSMWDNTAARKALTWACQRRPTNNMHLTNHQHVATYRSKICYFDWLWLDMIPGTHWSLRYNPIDPWPLWAQALRDERRDLCSLSLECSLAITVRLIVSQSLSRSMDM